MTTHCLVLTPWMHPHQAVSWVSKLSPGKAANRHTVPETHSALSCVIEQHVSAHWLVAQRPERQSPSPSHAAPPSPDPIVAARPIQVGITQ